MTVFEGDADGGLGRGVDLVTDNTLRCKSSNEDPWCCSDATAAASMGISAQATREQITYIASSKVDAIALSAVRARAEDRIVSNK